jgi:O-antigen/teichoic acid export membrane protein
MMSSLSPIPAAPAGVIETQKFRSQMGQISLHSGVFFVGTMFTAAMGYLFKVYLAHVLGAEALGIYALGMTITGLLGLFSGLGLPQSAVRFVALYAATGKNNQLRAFLFRGTGLLLFLNALTGLFALLAGPWVAERFYHTPALSTYFNLFALIMLLGALTTFFGQVLQGYKNVTRRTVIVNFVGTPLTMLLTMTLIVLGKGLWGYIFAQVLSAGAVLVLLIISVWRQSPSTARRLTGPLPPLESEVFSFGATVFGVGMLEFLLAQADKILIGFYINAREVGIYAVAMAIVAFIPLVLQSVNQIFSPTIADLHARGEHELLRRLFQTLTKWILCLALPLATVTIVFAKPLMRIFGHDFETGWLVLVIGALGQLANCAAGSVGYLLLMSGNQRRLIKVQGTMAGITVLLSAFLIPMWGIVGAAVSIAATAALSNAWYLRELRSSLGMSPYNRDYLHLIPAAAASLAAALVLHSTMGWVRPEWAVIALSGGVCYALVLTITVTMGLGDDDRLIARSILARIRTSFGKPRVNAA